MTPVSSSSRVLLPEPACLVETKAPEGYNKLAKPIEITIADTTTGVNTPFVDCHYDGRRDRHGY